MKSDEPGGTPNGTNFQVFERPHSPGRSPTVTIYRRGIVALNDASVRHLRSCVPRRDSDAAVHVHQCFDGEARRVAFRAVESDRNSYRLRPTSGKSYLLAGTAFLKFHGIEITRTQRFDATVDGDMLVVQLPAAPGAHDGSENVPGAKDLETEARKWREKS